MEVGHAQALYGFKMHWELSACRLYSQHRVSNIFSEENLLQDLELQTDSNTRSYDLRHNMLLFLKERGDISYNNYLFWHRLG